MIRTWRRIRLCASFCALCALSPHTSGAQKSAQSAADRPTTAVDSWSEMIAAKVKVTSDGTTELPAFAIPFSRWASPEAKAAFIYRVSHPYLGNDVWPKGKNPKVDQLRIDNDNMLFKPWLSRALARYPVNIKSYQIAGIRVDDVSPKADVAPYNRDRILINLHNGGFLQGGGGTAGQLESVPVASIGKIRVVSVDYRMWPEFGHPAALEDLAKVYSALLKTYKPENIGIYGYSAGALMAAESTEWFRQHGLPRAGALVMIGTSGGTAFDGDSAYFAPSLAYGYAPPKPGAAIVPNPHGYFTLRDLSNPLAAPILSPAYLSRFPQSLLITGSRDMAMSSTVNFQRRLVSAGADAELQMWDGMWYCFPLDPDLPESTDAYHVIVDFFRRNLGAYPSRTDRN
jgi:monoterpene epsilon-lactone hydrolase